MPTECLELIEKDPLPRRLAGAILGLGGALMLTRVLSFLLFGVTPFDPATYATIVAIVSASALAASWIPARRATRVNPTDALRNG